MTQDAIISLAIKETPALISAFKELFAHDHADVPAPTDEDVIAAFQRAFTSSLAKDDAWRAAHPR